MLYLYNYSFIKFLNSLWVYLVIIFLLNIILLIVSPFICLAEGDINLKLEDKEILNSLPEDNIIRKICEETGTPVSEVISKTKAELKMYDEVGAITHNKTPEPLKFILEMVVYVYLGGFFARGFVYTLVRFTQGEIHVCKLPFVSKLVPVSIIVRIGWLLGLICFSIQYLPIFYNIFC